MADYINRREIIKVAYSLAALNMLPAYYKKAATINQKKEKKNILIVLFDTLSALHLSMLGYERNTDKNIQRLAERSTVYHNHYSGGIFTTTGTASLLTGAYPFTHRAFQLNGTVASEFESKNIFSTFNDYYRIAYSHNVLANTLLSQFQSGIDKYKPREELFYKNEFLINSIFSKDTDIAFLSWARILQDNIDDYSNSLFLSNTYNSFSKQLEDTHSKNFPRGVPKNQGDFFLLENATDWILTQLRELPQPFLAYIHLIPPHHPYNTRSDFYNKFINDGYTPINKPEHFFSQGVSYSTLVNRRRYYDEYILYVDSEFGRLYNGLSESGILDNTILLFTSDHGEMFERGIWEHTVPTIHQPVIRIPLLISQPGQQNRIDIDQPTSSIDVLPTLLSLCDKKIPEWCEGQVLPPYIENKSGMRTLYAIDAKKNEKYKPIDKATTMLLEWPYKLMKYTNNKRIPGYSLYYELFDIEADPEEMINLYTPQNLIAKKLIEKLDQRINIADEPYR